MAEFLPNFALGDVSPETAEFLPNFALGDISDETAEFRTRGRFRRNGRINLAEFHAQGCFRRSGRIFAEFRPRGRFP
ncbi:MAG: hypothetical protein Q8881_04140 [Sweet potato little leaf phytoplasma]|nr:hypothetical protein [Sweet potato little leaf phytoplasma]